LSGTGTERPAVGTPLSLDIESIATGGDAFARWSPDGADGGIAVFADSGLPGDRVRGTVVASRGRLLRVAVDAIERAAPGAVEPACTVADTCGGCRFWRAHYSDELRWKADANLEAIRRLSGDVAWPDATVTGATDVTGYRGRARLRFDDDGGLGFVRARSSDVVRPDRCLVLHPAIDAARGVAEAIFGGVQGIDAVFIEYDAVREGVALTAELRLRDATDTFRKVRARLERLGPLPEITTVVIASSRRTASLRGDGCVHRRRSAGAVDVVVRDPAGAFSQAHEGMNATLVARVVEALGAASAPGTNALDLYSGSGNLTFPMLGLGLEVDAVEIARPAVDAAAAALRPVSASLPSARFHVGDLGRGLPEPVAARADAAELVVVDPPRGGLSAPLAASLSSLRSAHRLVYVSCDPPALARDAARLASGGWAPVSLELLDLFPRTPHVEAIAVFERSR
jgi:23S rRNA (uracil1939-C5)-methyltransferase